MKKLLAETLEIKNAVRALQPFYDPEDDGYPVTLALDALAGVLGRRAHLEVDSERGLSMLLKKLKAPRDLRASVEKLYKNAERGEYGAGLSKRQARTINDLVQEVVDPIVEFITSYAPPRVSRPAARSSVRGNAVVKRRKH